MSSTPVNQQERDALRETFGKKADSILEGLKSKSKGSYDRADLRELGVSLHRVDITEGFGPTGQKFPDFKPLSEREFRSYKIESADLPEHIREHYDGFDDAFRYSPEYSLPESDRNYEKAFQISRYIKILYNYSKKRTLTMSDHSKWYEIM